VYTTHVKVTETLRPTQAPTHVRYWVIVFAVALAVVTYIDRVCISQAAPLITRDLGFSKEKMGLIFSAFTLAYSLFEIPGGYLGDRMGARRVLMRIVLWWSVFTAATGFAWNYVSMLVTRFLFGAGEAGCFPNLTKSFTTWLPIEERVRAQGILWTAARWGGAFTPLLVNQVLKWMSWRQAFMLFGGVGAIWAVLFFRWYRDNPREKKSVNAAELELIEMTQHLSSSHTNVPWGKLIRSRQAWLLCIQYFCLSYSWYFYITWLPTYLLEARHVTLDKGALLATLPLLLGGFGSLSCGLLYPLVTRWTGDGFTWFFGGGDFSAAIQPAGGCHLGDDCHGCSQLFQRPGDAGKLGRVHGCGRKVRRYAVGHDEHGGQPGRRSFGSCYSIHSAPHEQRLECDFLRRSSGLFLRDPLLAIPGSGDAARKGGVVLSLVL
jgi:MFS family permease